MRKLATIQIIKELNPVPNSDNLEVATILGWKVVVRKGEFQPGDKCVYCEIDSVLPDKPEFAFLSPKKFRIRTCRLRGQISQGIAFPLDLTKLYKEREKPIGTKLCFNGECIDVEEGTDVTEFLGITQYIPQIPACIAGQVKGVFPNFIPKTDETRVQVLQDVLTRYKGTPCYITEKIDGSSVTYYVKDGEFGVCSRNLELKEDDKNAFWEYAKKVGLKEKMLSKGVNFALQGELIGSGIQKNNLKIPEKSVLFFNAFDIDKYKYLDFEQFVIFIKELKLEIVPILDTNFILTDNIDELVKLSIGTSKLNPKVYREGIVIRPLQETVDLQMAQGLQNGRVSFKVINPEYLLAYED